MSRFSQLIPRVLPLGAMLLAVVAVASAYAEFPRALVIPLGVIVVLVLPGYAWTVAFSDEDRAPAVAMALTVIASMGIAIVVAVCLNALPDGLTDHSWSIALAVAAAAGLITGRLRRRRTSWRAKAAPTTSNKDSSGPTRAASRRPSAGTVAKVIATVVAVGATIVISITSEDGWTKNQRFTVLTLLRDPSGLPVTTVTNHEAATVTYTLTAWVDGRDVRSDALRLRSGAIFSQRLDLPHLASAQLLEVTLSRAGSRLPYRAVWLRSHPGQTL